MTPAAELVLIDDAIERVLTKGLASYSIDGYGGTSLALPDLYKRKAELEAVIAAAAGTSRTLVARFGRVS